MLWKFQSQLLASSGLHLDFLSWQKTKVTSNRIQLCLNSLLSSWKALCQAMGWVQKLRWSAGIPYTFTNSSTFLFWLVADSPSSKSSTCFSIVQSFYTCAVSLPIHWKEGLLKMTILVQNVCDMTPSGNGKHLETLFIAVWMNTRQKQRSYLGPAFRLAVDLSRNIEDGRKWTGDISEGHISTVCVGAGSYQLQLAPLLI